MINIVKKLLVVSMIFNGFVFGGFQSALQKQSFIPPTEAFKVSAVQKGDTIVTTINLAEKIHIYKDSMKFKAEGDKEAMLSPDLPIAKELEGEMVYEGTINITIPVTTITSQVAGDYTFTVEFQGCSDAGLCYAPVSQSYQFKGKKPGVFEKIAKLSKEGNASKIVDVLMNESPIFILFLFFVFGLLLSLTPCIFPMIPILSSIIVSKEGGNEKPNMGRAFFISFVYVLAMALTYTIVGLVAGLVGADLQAAMQNPWVLTVFAGVFVALALSLFGYYEIGLPASIQSKLTKASDNAQGKGIAGTAVMGALSALIVGPCTAAPISGAVLFISHTGDALLGGAALFVMSMGMGMPLLLVGLGAGKFMPRPGGWMTKVSQTFGVMMLALAVFMLSRILPDTVTMALWSLLLMGTAIYMGVFSSREGEGAMKLFRLLALVFLLYGTSLFIGALSGAESMFRPFEKFTSCKGSVIVKTKSREDQDVHLGYSIARLQKEIADSDKPVVVDFGKDSCTACKELEEITFPDASVQEELKRFTFIQIDLTANSKEDQALLKEYGLFGTPNIIFFDKENNYLPEKSLTGFVKPEDFVEHLKGI